LSLPQPDHGVLRKAQRGDERAFSIIVRTYQVPVYNYVLRMVGDRSLAEDLTQEVFLRVFQGPAALLAQREVHDVALPGDEEPRARRAPGDRAPPRAVVDLDDIPPLEVSTRRSSGSRRSTRSGARSSGSAST
jgi:DNA-directed RNA polymerase specialized sigma subunit, sigma24 homolog